MIRGTNAQFRFEIPYDFDDVEYINIHFWQDGNSGPSENRPLPIIKTKSDCTWLESDKQIVVRLAPEETARFMDDRKAITQYSGTTFSGVRFANKQYLITVYPLHDNADIGDIIPPPNMPEGFILDAGVVGE